MNRTPALDGFLTPDRRYLVVRGRLWRAANPSLSEADRTQWTHTLMDARRDVGRARRLHDAAAERDARQRVHAAKVALGERGPVWWDDGAPDLNRRMVHTTPYAEWYARAEQWADAIGRLLDARSPGASICPSDVARAVSPERWRADLDGVRDVARHLARRGALAITQGTRVLDPDAPLRGPIRLRRPVPAAGDVPTTAAAKKR